MSPGFLVARGGGRASPGASTWCWPAKPGGGAIAAGTFADFADVPVEPVEGGYPLVYVVFNTFFALLTQEDQVRCFAGVAGHLAPGGAFVLTGFVPDPTLLRLAARACGPPTWASSRSASTPPATTR